MRASFLCPLIFLAAGMAGAIGDEPKAGPKPIAERGREIVVCGERVAIGTPVILWNDPGGYNAYAPNFEPAVPGKDERTSRPPGFGARRHNLSEAQRAEIQQHGWTLPLLREVVDQFVIHYDVCGTSGRCFDVLINRTPPLSVHFMLDLDGTIYQTLDLKEAAYHATIANGRSIGIEIANMGAYAPDKLDQSPLPKWYARAADGRTQIRLPEKAAVPTLAPGAPPLEPSRPEPITGRVQGQQLAMYDLTPAQYGALARLTEGLCNTFPRIHRDFPRDAQGQVLDHQLDADAYKSYQGILGHFHVQRNKIDPGPAFQWDRIVPPRQP